MMQGMLTLVKTYMARPSGTGKITVSYEQNGNGLKEVERNED